MADENSSARLPLLATVFGVLLLVAIIYYGRRLMSGGRPSPETLTERALSAASETEKEEATIELSRLGPKASPHLRKLLAESDSPQVRAVCIQSLGSVYDYESMPAILEALDDESRLVRGRAEVAASKMLGRDYGLRRDLSEDERARIVTLMRTEWEALDGSPLLEAFKKTLVTEGQEETED